MEKYIGVGWGRSSDRVQYALLLPGPPKSSDLVFLFLKEYILAAGFTDRRDSCNRNSIELYELEAISQVLSGVVEEYADRKNAKAGMSTVRGHGKVKNLMMLERG